MEQEIKARICPSGKLLCLSIYKTLETVHKGQLLNLLDNRASMSLHLTLAVALSKLPILICPHVYLDTIPKRKVSA